jgi:ADP-ribosyl-[dinitrogen reductase] hydrolase
VSDLESGKARAATGGEYHEFMALVAAGTGAGIHFLPGTFALIGRGVQPALAGAIMGAKNGMQQIPSRLLTFLPAYPSKPSNPAGPYSWECAVCQLEKGWQERPRYPGADCGPVEVLPGIFAAGFEAAKKYAYGMAAEGAGILSLCRTFGVFDDIPIRREMSYLVDSPDQNPGLYYMVHDAVTTASAWKKEGRRVLVHCHGGASRTGLILRALAMHMFDEPAWKALCRVRDAWPIFSEWNTDFSVALERAEKDIRSPSYSLTH